VISCVYCTDVGGQWTGWSAGTESEDQGEGLLWEPCGGFPIQEMAAEAPSRNPGFQLVAADLIGSHLKPLKPGILDLLMLESRVIWLSEGLGLVHPVFPRPFVTDSSEDG
jgi:hypothetical protein